MMCPVCHELYGKSIRPRGLSCGHSYCTECLKKLIDDGTLICPSCQKEHRVSDAFEIAINFDLEECLKASASRQINRDPNAKCQTREKLVQKQIMQACEQQNSVRKMKQELSDYDHYLCDSSKEHMGYAQKCHALAKRHKTAAKEMEEEMLRIENFQKEADSCIKKLKDNLKILDCSECNDAAVVSVIGNSVELEDWLENSHQQFPNTNMTSMRKVLLDSLSYVDDDISEEKKPTISQKSDLTILEKVAHHIQEIPFPDVRNRLLDPQWKERISSGQVVAINSDSGRPRCAMLSMKDDKIYLHYLQDEIDPTTLFRLKHSDLISCLNQDATVAFLDLSWENTYRGRVHILLSPDTPLTRQFRILCTGDLGYTYAHSRFYEVMNFDESSECLRGGDYQWNNGNGGKAVVHGINTESTIYQRKGEAGIVWATSASVANKGAQFTILTGDGDVGDRVFDAVYGKVQDGMRILKGAVQRLQTAEDVEISDCGVILL